MLNLDTHIVVDLLRGELSAAEIKALDQEELCISAIVLWELSKLISLGRLTMDLKSRDFTNFLSSITVYPLDVQVVIQSNEMDFKSDPADELIAATSVVLGAPLMTRDRKIKRSKLISCVP